MKLRAYSIYDVKPEVFHPPFMAMNIGDAIRRFHRMLNEAPHFKGYEEDYSLYEVGLFDDKAGVLISPENGVKKLIISAKETLGRYDETTMEKPD